MLRCASMFALLVAFTVSAADAKLSVKSATVAVPDAIKDSIRSLLSDQAYVVSDEKGAVCTIWFRTALPAKATPEQVKNGLTYREIPVTSVIGAIQFDKTFTDFRQQEIEPGVYTLRLAIQPADGDHMGTAPHNEFCLLVPAAKDEKPDTMPVKTLHELSGDSTGGTHPGVILLFPNAKPDDEPKIVGKGNGIFVLNVKRPIQAGDAEGTIGFGVTVAGHAAE